MPKNPLSAMLDDPLVTGAKSLGKRAANYVASGSALRDSAKFAAKVTPDLLMGGLPRAMSKAMLPAAQGLVQDAKQNPVRAVADFLPVVGSVMSAADIKDLRQKALEAKARGDMAAYRRYSEMASAAAGGLALGMVPVPGAKGAVKATVRAGERAAENAATRSVKDLVGRYGLGPPAVRVDNPGGEWLKSKRRDALENAARRETSGYAPNAPSGPITGYLSRPVLVNPQTLQDIPGAMRERPRPGTPKYDRLLPSMRERGYDAEAGGPILIGISHTGEPFIMEGNNRAAVARDLGIPAIPAEIRYFSGGEGLEGAMSPSRLAEYLYRPEEGLADLAAKYGLEPK